MFLVQQSVFLTVLHISTSIISAMAGIPNRPLGGGGGHSAFLQKRLAKGQKYFDSGDYQMAQQKGRLGAGRMAMPVLVQPPTGEAHPTPDSVPGIKTTYVGG